LEDSFGLFPYFGKSVAQSDWCGSGGFEKKLPNLVWKISNEGKYFLFFLSQKFVQIGHTLKKGGD